jgi:hypothetical protein
MNTATLVRSQVIAQIAVLPLEPQTLNVVVPPDASVTLALRERTRVSNGQLAVIVHDCPSEGGWLITIASGSSEGLVLPDLQSLCEFLLAHFPAQQRN